MNRSEEGLTPFLTDMEEKNGKPLKGSQQELGRDFKQILKS